MEQAHAHGLICGLVSLGASIRQDRLLRPKWTLPQGCRLQISDLSEAGETLTIVDRMALHELPMVGGASHHFLSAHLCVMALQAAILYELQGRMRKALRKDGKVQGAKYVRGDLLSFQILYHDWVFSGTGWAKTLNAEMSKALFLRETLVEIAKETDRISDVADSEVRENSERLLFWVGLGTIFEGSSSLLGLFQPRRIC